LKLKFKGEDVSNAPLVVTFATVAENGVVCDALLPVPTSVNE
jgi:D-ribose pyranose/furanose isomerase RbsD